MLKFARNKLVSVARTDNDMLSVHGVLDDDVYGVEVDLQVRIQDMQFLSIGGKWNRWTTPECPRALDFLQEAKGLCIDGEIDGKLHKIVGRKACRHFANLLIECCYAATEAARVARWEDAKADHPDLSLKEFLAASKDVRENAPERNRAPEQEPVVATETGHGAAVHTKQSDPQPISDSGEYSTAGFVIDLHVHTFPASPCSSASADQIIEEAKRIGLDGVCLTDHNHVWTPDRVKDLSQKHGFLILRGNEITTDQGDMLVFGLEKDIKGIVRLQDLKKEVDRAEGFIIAAHPFRGFLTFGAGQLGLTPERAGERALFQWVDAIEVMNGKVTESENQLAASVAKSLRLPATGGSDAHEADETGHYATRFPATIRTETELLSALKNGHYTPVAFRRTCGRAQNQATLKAVER